MNKVGQVCPTVPACTSTKGHGPEGWEGGGGGGRAQEMILMMTKIYLLSFFRCQTLCQAFCNHDLINCYMTASKRCWAIARTAGLRVREVQ